MTESKINISIIGYGHIGKNLVSGIEMYNNLNSNKINIVNILVKDISKYNDPEYNFTQNPEDVINDKSDLVLDLTSDIENSINYLPKLIDSKKSILLANKIFLSDHSESIFKKAKENNVSVLIGSCISSSLPIRLSKNNPYYNGSEYKEVRGNGADEFARRASRQPAHQAAVPGGRRLVRQAHHDQQCGDAHHGPVHHQAWCGVVQAVRAPGQSQEHRHQAVLGVRQHYAPRQLRGRARLSVQGFPVRVVWRSIAGP